MKRPEISEQITFLYSPVYDESKSFYGDILGLERVLDQGGCCLYRVADGGFLGICEIPDQAENEIDHSGIIFTLVTPDVDGWYQHLKAHGVPLERAPVVNDAYRIYHFFLRDPAGYKIEVQRFLDSGWNRQD